MVSKRRERFLRLVRDAYDLPTGEIALWLRDPRVQQEKGFVLSRAACLRVYAQRIFYSGHGIARDCDLARQLLGILPTRLR